MRAEDWDAALAGWPRAHLLQSHGWGEVQAASGWRVRRLAVEVPGRDAVLPVLALLGGRRPLPRRLYVPRGPACDVEDAAAWEAALAALERLASVEGAALVTVEPPVWAQEAAELGRRLGPGWSATAGMQPEHTAIVDLDGGFDAVLARMRPKGRYNVRLAQRRGVTVVSPDDPGSAADVLGRLCAATAARQRITQPTAAHLRLVLERVPGARVHIAAVEGEAVAGALVAPFAGEAVYLYGGSVSRHRQRQPSALLHAEVMRQAVDAGLHRYDLWGIPADDDPGHPWHGLRQFKLSLGGSERATVGAMRRVRRPVGGGAVSAAAAARHAGRRLLRSIAGARPRGRR